MFFLNKNFPLLLLLFLFNNSLKVTAQQDTVVFEDLILNNALPEVFQTGEIYILKGNIVHFDKTKRLAIDYALIESDLDYQKNKIIMCHDQFFEVELDFKYAGTYNLSITLDYQHKGTKILKVVDYTEKKSQPVARITSFQTDISDFSAKLVWQTNNEIIQLKIIQDDLEKNYILSNNPSNFETNHNVFSEFKEGPISFMIRGARSNDGSWYSKNSDWGKWQKIENILIYKIPHKINPYVQFVQQFNPKGKIDSELKYDLIIGKNYAPDVYIIRPDGRVDKIRLESDKKLNDYSIGGMIKKLYIAGKCSFEYIPRQTGTYIIEINDAFGNALVNIPYYCGDLLPVFEVNQENERTANKADFDVTAERNKVLNEINSIRQKLGINLLRSDQNLTNLSQYYSDRMANEGFCGHIAPKDKEVLGERKNKFKVITSVLENVAMAPTIAGASLNLQRSPAHYSAMIDSTVNRAGIGISFDGNNHYFIAQHFSPEPYSKNKLEVFLTNLLVKMQVFNRNLKRVENDIDRPDYIFKATYTAPSLNRLESLIFSEDSKKTWLKDSIGGIYFSNFNQTLEGLNLEIKLYLLIKENEIEDVKKNK